MSKHASQPSKKPVPERLQEAPKGKGFEWLLEPLEDPEVLQVFELLANVISCWNEAVVVLDFDGKIMGWNAAAQNLYGYTESEAVGRQLLDFTPVSRQGEIKLLLRKLQEQGEVVTFDTQRTLQAGRIMDVQTTLGLVRDAKDQPRAVISIEREMSSRDVNPFFTAGPQHLWDLIRAQLSEMQRANQSLHQEKRLFEVTLESIGDAVFTTDCAGRVTYLNPLAEEILGWPKAEALGLPCADVLQVRNEATGQAASHPVALCLATGEITRINGDILLIQRDGKELFIEGTVAPIFAAKREVIGAVLIFRDGTEKRQLMQRLSHQAIEDALTGLENRRGFERNVKQLLESPRVAESCALLYLDLDQFKIVNDIGGHPAGDTLLRQIGPLVEPHLRPGDRLARLGGDEFGILLESCSREGAVELAHAIRETVRNHHFEWEGKLFTVGASIGVVPIPATGATLSSLLIAADDACYAAKERGGNRVWVYELNDSSTLQRHGQMEWVGRINEALRHDHFCLYFQPISSLGGAAPKKEWGEILLRLLDDKFRVILPQQFTPAAERYGLMPAIDRWVLRNSLATLQSWNSADLLFSVNLSGHSLSDEDFLNFVVAEFRRTRVNPSQVCFEITETAAISNLSYAMRFISILKEVGCLFALDDFGTGLSSFEYLRNLPIDYLKIAGRFVENMAADRIDYAMVEGIHHIAQVMGLKTIAEHVEVPATLAGLHKVGVDFAQGNLLGSPRALNAKAAKMK